MKRIIMKSILFAPSIGLLLATDSYIWEGMLIQAIQERIQEVVASVRYALANMVSFFEAYFRIGLSQLILLPLAFIFVFWYVNAFHGALSWRSAIYVYTTGGLSTFFFFKVILDYYLGRKSRRAAPFLVLAFAFYLLHWIPFGVDLTDQGRRMMHSWFLPDGYITTFMTLRAGSNIVSSFWANMVSFPSIGWIRLGYLLIMISNLLLATQIVRRTFTTNFLGFAMAATFLPFTIYMSMTLDYNNIPLFFLLLGIYFLSGIQNRRLTANGELRSIMLGALFMIVAAYAKLTFITFPILLVLFTFLPGKRLSNTGLSNGGRIFALAIGFVSGMIGCYVVGNYFGFNQVYLNHVSAAISNFFSTDQGITTNHGHTIGNLSGVYLRSWWNLLLAVLAFGALIATSIGLSTITRRFWRFFIHIGLFIGMFLVAGLFKWHEVVLGIIGSILLLLILIKKVKRKHLFLSFWSLALFFCTYLASNNGVKNIVFTGGTVLVLPYLLIVLKESLPKFGRKQVSLRYLTLTSAIFLILFSVTTKPKTVYRDAPLEQLTRNGSMLQTVGIASTVAKMNEIENYLRYLDRNVDVTSSILCVNTVPLLSYLGDRYYYSGWKFSRNESEQDVVDRLLGKTGPEYILFNKMNSRDPNWPIGNAKFHESDQYYFDFYQRLSDQAFEKIYEGQALILYRRAR